MDATAAEGRAVMSRSGYCEDYGDDCPGQLGLYRAIRAALVERRRALRDEIHATCQAPRLRSRHLFGLVRQRDELKRALRVMAGVKNRWTARRPPK
jgi:hypothetical protein